ncbi:glycosyltransferase family 2 protein [Azonexus sp.]|uniref:glycosyltransferase family 2 protein n=1 Tax=Azonexus sp. TaxID=1872668 RepID=UPI0039E487CB
MDASCPTISVIIPSYNYGHLLPRALDSVLPQLAENDELIVIDDGSTDDTATRLAEYTTRHPRLSAVHQENAGAAAARNHGIRLAKAPYVLLLDADDELMPNALNVLRAIVSRDTEVGMVLGAQISVHPDGRERLRLPTAVPKASAKELARRYLLSKSISISHCCSLFRRDLLLQRPYPENLRSGEDIPVFCHLLVSAPVLTTEQALARIHKHADSLRHLRDDEEERALTIVDEVFSSLPTECQPLRQRYRAQRYLSLFRAALNAGEMPRAGYFYRRALRLNPLQALRWTYLRKGLRWLLSS